MSSTSISFAANSSNSWNYLFKDKCVDSGLAFCFVVSAVTKIAFGKNLPVFAIVLMVFGGVAVFMTGAYSLRRFLATNPFRTLAWEPIGFAALAGILVLSIAVFPQQIQHEWDLPARLIIIASAAKYFVDLARSRRRR